MRDLELEADCENLGESDYEVKSPRDPRYNCIAYAVGDLTHFWDDLGLPNHVKVPGYYWPPGAPSIDILERWIKVFEFHGYKSTDNRSLETDYEKIAIYVGSDGPEHVARQKASGAWVSKAGKGVDLEHYSLECLEGDLYGKVSIVMKRKCKDGKRVLE